MPLAPGDVFANYTVVRQIGTGGMGTVYLVRHPRLPRFDALKLLRPDLSTNPDFARRFLREADVVAGLSHHNIVAVHDRGEHDGQLWLTMKYVDGVDAEQALADSGNLLPAARVVHIVGEVAAALDAAHRQHVIHRDVKPANILLAPSSDDEPEQVFLTDFGIAKSLADGNAGLTGTGEVLASFDYASPEHIESGHLDARSDVYGLAGVLHKLLTGSVPYPGPGVAAAIQGHIMRPPPRPSSLVPWLAPGIDDVVARGMAKNPADRFANCRALAAAAAAALDDFPPPPKPPYTVTLSQPGTGIVVGPMTTDRLSKIETDRFIDLVRRTRFFDLPENLHEVAGRTNTGPLPRGGRPVTLEIRAGRSVRRVTADLMEVRRPETIDALVEIVENLPASPVGAAGDTVIHDLRGMRVATGVATPSSSQGGSVPTGPPPPRRTGDAARSLAPSGGGLRRTSIRIVLSTAALLLVAATGGDSDLGRAWSSYRALPRATALSDSTLIVPRDVGGDVDLYLIDADTGTVIRRLTSTTDNDLGPQISPDRQTMLFLRKVDEDVRQLMTVSVAGTGERPAFTGVGPDCPDVRRPAWDTANPTQLAIVCVRGTEMHLLVIALDGAVVRELDPGVLEFGDPSFSPDGTQLVYWGTDAQVTDPGTADAGATDVTNDSEVAGGAIYVLPVDGSRGPTQLTDGGTAVDADPIWSPDGSQIAFSHQIGDERRIMLMTAGGEGEREITHGPGLDRDPTWSPDGQRIAFRSNRPGRGSAGNHIWILDLGNETLREVDVEALAAAAPAWGSR